MLEIRNLKKVYRSKTGEEVRALDDVSISFPESGMVFILGKSGSGKSTLLNIMGGLDSYDSGEFIIKGKSSKDFGGSDFDAYRNTFIGFIFQEYNVLDDFSVGANIGLALELQGKKATNEKITDILRQVDLLSFAKRKPNELSGGQKQRVAIARALVKEPQIIMADEPTGALDSNTGKQIFDTLKELSREKLVLIVSHDRDFAERYADRIIELADGRIISDVTKHEKQSVQISEGVQQVTGNILRIKGGYRLTEWDLQMINNYLASAEGDVMLSSDGRVNNELRSAAGIAADGNATVFEGTAPEDLTIKQYQKDDSKFIRSRLPMKNALKIGSSSLKHKKFRLVMTIFLSLLAFAMFGFADSLGAYDKLNAAVESIQDSEIKTASLSLGVRHEISYDDNDRYVTYDDELMNDADLQMLKEKTGIDFVPVFAGTNAWSTGFSIATQFQAYERNTIYNGQFSGLVSISRDSAAKAGLTVTGRLPEATGEIAITELAYRQFNKFGFKNETMNESIKAGQLTMAEGDESSIIGQHITLSNVGDYNTEYTYKIVGVVDTNFDYDRFDSLLPSDEPTVEQNGLATMVLTTEAENELLYGFHMLAYLTEADLDTISTDAFSTDLGEYMHGVMDKGITFFVKYNDPTQQDEIIIGETLRYVAGSEALSLIDVTWLDGTARTVLGANEIVVPESLVEQFLPTSAEYSIDAAAFAAKANELYATPGEDLWSETDEALSYIDRLIRLETALYIREQVAKPGIAEAIAYYKHTHIDLSEAPFDPAQNGMTEEEAAQFWYDFWFVQGEPEAPIREYQTPIDIPVTNRDSEVFRLNASNKIAPYLYSLLGPELPEKFFTDDKYTANRENYLLAPHIPFSPSNFLSRVYNDNPVINVDRGTLEEILSTVYASIDTIDRSLWTNQAFIETVILADQSMAEQWKAADLPESEKQWIAYVSYQSYLFNTETGGYTQNTYGTHSGQELREMANRLIQSASNLTLNDILSKFTFSLREEDTLLSIVKTIHDYNFTIVGVFSADKGNDDLVISNTIYADYKNWYDTAWDGTPSFKETVADHAAGKWSFVLAPMPTDEDTIRTLVEMNYDEESDLQFSLQNAVMNTLRNFNDFIEIGAKVFLYVGIGFAVFSALLLMNFIATSISYKKREIGVLRAVGARSSDVFKIFFSEALIIALINFILAIIAAIAAVIFTNGLMRTYGINITLLSFGPRQIILMLIVSAVVALLASFLPVYSIAKRKPIDAIKDR